ncbi:MAG: SUF system NifU family Fe-S cluster assembly protein [Bryobacterales bacterium]|nr:SUF system NifU family Fe-S cluster assembly protein [Bryobacterales bacterium]
MANLRDLYQELIVDHSKQPRNFRVVTDADRHAEGHNPLCGDRVTIYIKMEGERISDVAFRGSGCAISTASASLLTESLKGRTATEAENIFDNFHNLVTGAGETGPLGKLAAFSGVCDYPTRVKCATLAWHTFHAALRGAQADHVSTEKA